jgi:hypothetical protein
MIMRPTLAILSTIGCHELETPPAAPRPTITEALFLTQPAWDDGKGEVAFYEGWIAGGDGAKKTFSVGSYLVKHAFDPAKQSKAEAGGVPGFKWAMFYEHVSGTEQFKHSYVVNVGQVDFAPLKVSANRFDWCSNQYRELAFLAGGRARVLMRSDDYGNVEETVDVERLTYPAVSVPFLVRATDFTKVKQLDLYVLELDGSTVGAMIEIVGKEVLQVPQYDGDVEAEKILIHYAKPVASILGVETSRETYWRGPDAQRTLLAMEGDGATHGLRLVESVRSAYWQEDIFPKLQRVKTHP